MNAASIRLDGVQVLVVDDDEDIRALHAEVLRLRGANVRVADSMRSALDALASGATDVLVSDVEMVEDDGCDLVRRARTHDPRLRAVAISGYASREDQQRALDAGFERFLAKPLEPDALVMAVDALRPRA